MRSPAAAHSGPLALFAALALAWTWPLAAHLGDAIPGLPGDNYSFLWDLWWVRTALDTPGLAYFRTNYLFYPFGVDMVGQSHVALPGLVAATVLRPLTPAAAHNVMLLTFVFANMGCMYALAWDLTRHVRASVAAAIVFGLSPYLSAHLVGHFELMAAWPLPLFALLLGRALDGSRRAAWGAAIVVAVTAYTTYYYVVYIGLFSIVYLTARLDVFSCAWSRRRRGTGLERVRTVLAFGVIVLAALAAWIAWTGGTAADAAPFGVSMTRPQNPLTAMWALAIAWALCTWRPSLSARLPGSVDRRRVAFVLAAIAGVFVIAAAPLVAEAIRVIARGEYVSQAYSWRSAPRGVDLLTPLMGPLWHPALRDTVHRLYASAHVDAVEAVGWLGIVPLVIVFGVPATGDARWRVWWAVAVVFAVLALGPYLTIGGFDTGLRLPEILLRFVPVVSNARMPGRMMVIVFVALAALAGLSLARAQGRWASPAVQWLLIALVVFEYWDAPIPITRLDRPLVYQTLAQQPPGGVCEVPFGIGDGLSTGVGSQERSVLYYATIHGHPLVGGVVSRMPVDARNRYERMAIAGDLLRLSDGRPAADPRELTERSPCTYLVVRDRGLSLELRTYVHQLPLRSIAGDAERELFAVSDSLLAPEWRR